MSEKGKAKESFEKQILNKMDTLISLQIQIMLKDFKTNKEKIGFLHSMDFKPSEIHVLTKIPMQTIYNSTSKSGKQIVTEGEISE